jgi:hypothetical protein
VDGIAVLEVSLLFSWFEVWLLWSWTANELFTVVSKEAFLDVGEVVFVVAVVLGEFETRLVGDRVKSVLSPAG